MIYHFGEWLKVWMSVVADLVTVVALIGAFFGWKSIAGKRLEAEKAREMARRKREAWWRRVQWGIELATSADPNRQYMGIQALQQFALGELTTPEDLKLMEALTGVYLGASEEAAQSASGPPSSSDTKPTG